LFYGALKCRIIVFFEEEPAEPYTELGIFVWRSGSGSDPERTFDRYRERAFGRKITEVRGVAVIYKQMDVIRDAS